MQSTVRLRMRKTLRARRLTKQPRNTLWCADFKGEFKLGNGRYCYLLTVSDHASRYLLLCEAFEINPRSPVIAVFQRLFRDRGLPVAIRIARTRMFPGMTGTSWPPLAADRVAQLALYPPPVRPAVASCSGFSISARISSTRHAVMRGPSLTGFGWRRPLPRAHHVDFHDWPDDPDTVRLRETFLPIPGSGSLSTGSGRPMSRTTPTATGMRQWTAAKCQ